MGERTIAKYSYLAQIFWAIFRPSKLVQYKLPPETIAAIDSIVANGGDIINTINKK